MKKSVVILIILVLISSICFAAEDDAEKISELEKIAKKSRVKIQPDGLSSLNGATFEEGKLTGSGGTSIDLNTQGRNIESITINPDGTVSFKTKKPATLTINGQQVTIDGKAEFKDGKFIASGPRKITVGDTVIDIPKGKKADIEMGKDLVKVLKGSDGVTLTNPKIGTLKLNSAADNDLVFSPNLVTTSKGSTFTSANPKDMIVNGAGAISFSNGKVTNARLEQGSYLTQAYAGNKGVEVLATGGSLNVKFQTPPSTLTLNTVYIGMEGDTPTTMRAFTDIESDFSFDGTKVKSNGNAKMGFNLKHETVNGKPIPHTAVWLYGYKGNDKKESFATVERDDNVFKVNGACSACAVCDAKNKYAGKMFFGAYDQVDPKAGKWVGSETLYSNGFSIQGETTQVRSGKGFARSSYKLVKAESNLNDFDENKKRRAFVALSDSLLPKEEAKGILSIAEDSRGKRLFLDNAAIEQIRREDNDIKKMINAESKTEAPVPKGLEKLKKKKIASGSVTLTSEQQNDAKAIMKQILLAECKDEACKKKVEADPVTEFQKKHKLKADGTIGLQTLHELGYQANAKKITGAEAGRLFDDTMVNKLVGAENKKVRKYKRCKSCGGKSKKKKKKKKKDDKKKDDAGSGAPTGEEGIVDNVASSKPKKEPSKNPTGGEGI